MCVRAHTHTHTAIGVTDGRVARAVLLYVVVLAQTCLDLRHLMVAPLEHERQECVVRQEALGRSH